LRRCETRLEEGGELNVEGTWRGEGKRSVSSQMQKRKKKGKFLPFFAFFFLPYGSFFSMFFSFLVLEKKMKKTPSSSSFIFLFLFEVKKTTTQVCHCFFFPLFFVANKATTISLL
jgi:hypothetical protein